MPQWHVENQEEDQSMGGSERPIVAFHLDGGIVPIRVLENDAVVFGGEDVVESHLPPLGVHGVKRRRCDSAPNPGAAHEKEKTHQDGYDEGTATDKLRAELT